jgi:hypothetical protein
MSRLTAVLYVEVDGLYVARELLGTTLQFQRQECDVTLQFPSDMNDFKGVVDDEFWSAVGAPSSGTKNDPEQRVSVNAMKVEVTGDSDLDPTTYGGSQDSRQREYFDWFRRAGDIGLAAIQDLCDWVRTAKEQAWLGETGAATRLLGVQSLLDAATGSRLPLGMPRTIEVSLRGDDAALAPPDTEFLLSALSKGTEPEVAELFLADARHALSYSEPRDPTRAVVLAAIALEVRTKQAVRRLASVDQRSLVDLVLDRPADVSISVVALLNVGLDAVVGRSLKAEDKALNDSVQKAMALRNDIVHRGLRPDPEQARAAVGAVVRANKWLGEVLRTDPRDPTATMFGSDSRADV